MMKDNTMLKHINMPVIVKAMCGVTIGFLVGMYVSNTFFGGAIHWPIYLCVTIGGGLGIWLFRR